MTTLCPAQQKAFDDLVQAFPIGHVFVLWSHAGMGRTTIIEQVKALTSGHLINLKDYIDRLGKQDPLKMEEVLEGILLDALDKHDVVLMDDLDLIYNVVCGCGYDSALMFPLFRGQ